MSVQSKPKGRHTGLRIATVLVLLLMAGMLGWIWWVYAQIERYAQSGSGCTR